MWDGPVMYGICGNVTEPNGERLFFIDSAQDVMPKGIGGSTDCSVQNEILLSAIYVSRNLPGETITISRLLSRIDDVKWTRRQIEPELS
jgi:hypothetical protein